MISSYDTATLKDQLTGALIGLARSVENNMDKRTEKTDFLILEGLFLTSAGVSTDRELVSDLIERVHKEKFRIVPDCSVCPSPCGHNDDYDFQNLRKAEEDIRSLKFLILTGIRAIASDAYHELLSGNSDPNANLLFYEVLCGIGDDSYERNDLLPLALNVGSRISAISILSGSVL